MLLLRFNLDKDSYVIDSKVIVEVLPFVRLKELPNSPACVGGILNYHGQPVPVIDINQLCRGLASTDTLTTRIILVNFQHAHLLGLIAEHVTETMRVDEASFKDVGINISEHDFLGKVSETEGQFLQLVRVDQILSDEVRALLYAETTKAIGT